MQLETIRERPVFSYKQFEQVPEPVARYFRRVLRDGQPFIRRAHFTQSGEFRSSATGKWKAFHATEDFSIDKPAFTWKASIRMAPLFVMNVQDNYTDGTSSITAKAWGIPILRAHDDRRLDKAALQRYLAESPWFPTSLLPGQNVTWSEVDKNYALATLRDCGIEVSMYFEFNDNGEIIGAFTPGRYQYAKGQYRFEPWGGHFRNYENRNGIRIPIEAEVEWLSPEENFCYYKGRIVEGNYDF
jgi:Family of unknown function (DUF6920)